MCFSGIFRLARSLAFFVLLWCPNGHNYCHVFKFWTCVKVIGFRISNVRECNVKLHIIRKFSIACQNWSGIAFVFFTSACEWCRKRTLSSSTNQLQNKNKSWLGPPRSSALLVVCLNNLCSHRLLIVIKLVMIGFWDWMVLFFRKSVENCTYRRSDCSGH